MKKILLALAIIIPAVVFPQRSIPKGGTSNQVLKIASDNINVAWGNAGSTMTFISPLSVNTNTVSISQSDTDTDGYVSYTDWNTFNNKQATLVSGTNIKTVNSSSLLGSGNLSVGTVTTVTVSTNDGVSGVVTNPTTTPSIAITLGAITPSTVNGNTITTGTGTLSIVSTATVTGNNTGDQDLSGYVPYSGATGTLNLNDKDLTNVNDFDCDTLLATKGTISNHLVCPYIKGGSGVNSKILYQGTTNAGTGTSICHQFAGDSTGNIIMQMNYNGLVGIGKDPSLATLDVLGSGYFTGAVTAPTFTATTSMYTPTITATLATTSTLTSTNITGGVGTFTTSISVPTLSVTTSGVVSYSLASSDSTTSIPNTSWVKARLAAIPSLFTDGGAFTYLTSTTDLFQVGSSSSLGASLGVKGQGSTPGTIGFKVLNSSNVASVTVKDDRTSVFDGDMTVYSLGSGSSTYMLTLANSTSTTKFRFRDSGYMAFGSQTPSYMIHGINTDAIKVLIGHDAAAAATAPTVTANASYIHLGASEYNTNSYRLISFGYSSQTNKPAFIGFKETANSMLTKGSLIFATRDVETDTPATVRMEIKTNGVINMLAMPTDTTTLSTGDLYRNASGGIGWKY